MKYFYLSIIVCLLLGCSNKGNPKNTDSEMSGVKNNKLETAVIEKNSVDNGYVKTTILFNYEFDTVNKIYNIYVGNLNYKIPSDYSISFFDGNTYILNRVNEYGFEKSFSITVFDKNSNYDDGESMYNAELCQKIERYINKIEDINLDGAFRINNINDIKIFDNLFLAQHEPTAIFSRDIIFFDDIYCYKINIWYGNQNKKMPENMPEYFEQDNYGIYEWNRKYSDLLDKYRKFELLPEYLSNLINDSDNILITLKFK